MIQISDKKNCAGCTACRAVCHKNAITMRMDEKGFKYPQVDLEKCVNCGLCDKVCVFDKKPEAKRENHFAYAVKHKDKQILKDSTSGGIFTAVSDYVLENDGVVYGATLDENIVVRHIRATTVEERNRMRGSKYVQSDMGDIFYRVKQDLADKKLVLFTGTPCQVAGLRSYLGTKSEGLICLDLICYGVPSPLIYKEHIAFLSKKYRSKITDYKFRPKKWGWHIHRELVCGEKKTYHSTPYTDLWQNLYYSRIITRLSCNNCSYSNLNRVGDITIGDCRGIDKVKPGFGSYEGVTLAIVNTEIGKKIFGKISDVITYEPLDIESVMQPPLRQCGKENTNSEKFFSIYQHFGYKKTISEFYGRLYPVKYYIKKLTKRI